MVRAVTWRSSNLGRLCVCACVWYVRVCVCVSAGIITRGCGSYPQPHNESCTGGAYLLTRRFLPGTTTPHPSTRSPLPSSTPPQPRPYHPRRLQGSGSVRQRCDCGGVCEGCFVWFRVVFSLFVKHLKSQPYKVKKVQLWFFLYCGFRKYSYLSFYVVRSKNDLNM